MFGGFFVTSLPPGADVWIDGTYIGRTPLLIDGLRAGKHSLTVTKTGWKVAEQDELLSGGVTTPVTIELQAASNGPAGDGTIAIHGVAAGAIVSIDGHPPIPVQSEYRVGAGEHRIIVRAQGARYERTIVVYGGQTTHMLLRPPLADARSAVVAPLSAYLPASAYTVVKDRLVIRWGDHLVVGRLGDARFTVDHRDQTYDAPAGLVRGKLYLPLDLILAITGKK